MPYRSHSRSIRAERVRTLSRREATVVLGLEAEGVGVVTLRELTLRARSTPASGRKLAHDLARKGWLQRVRRGVYLVNPGRFGPGALPDTDPLRLGRYLADPYYFGYGTAAQLLGLLPRAGRTYFIATPVRTAPPRGGAAEFRIVHCPRARFFGVRILRRRGESVVVSDLERTVLDCLERPEYAGDVAGAAQVLSGAKGRIRWPRLERYLARLGSRSLTLRLGYLVERVRPDLPVPRGWLRRALPRPNEPFVPLGPPRAYGRRGPRDARWHVIRNVPDERLLGEVRIG